MEVVLETVRPGVRERDVIAAVVRWSMEQCATTGRTDLLGAAGDAGAAAPPHLQNRVIERGDVVTVLIENSGTWRLLRRARTDGRRGRAPAELQEELELAIDAQRASLARLVPALAARTSGDAHNASSRARPAEDTRIHCHGQGYDLVERPLARFDETMSIEEGMHIAAIRRNAAHGIWS